MKRVAILTPSIAPADAVSNDILGERETLQRNGNDVRIFSELAAIRKFLKDSSDILIYHHSRGWHPGVQLVREMSCRRVIRYHNVTPAEFFEGFSRTDQDLCERGRRELSDLAAAQCDLYLSASSFSMQELIAIGADPAKSFVVPPFHHIDRLAQITADAKTLKENADGNARIVSVGRVVPHKGVLQLIEAFAHYYHGCNSNSRLIVVGKGGEGLNAYSKLLHRAVEKLSLNGSVVFTGGVSDEVLKAYYEVADVFATASEHEGFCVPLVEAMSMKLPITAFASSAIPETLGDAGIVWQERDPLLLAESIDRFWRDTWVRNAFGMRGRRRYERLFTNQKIEERFVEALNLLQ